MTREISASEVRHMATLSRLILGEEEEKLLSLQFGEIIGHMDVLNAVDTSGVDPLYSPAQHQSLARDDVASSTRTRADVLANAPETDGESFIVPRIV